MDQACPHQPFDSQEVTSPFWATGSSLPNKGLGHHKLHIYPPLSTDILYYKPETSANTIDLWGLLASPSVYLLAKKIKIKKKITPILQTFTFLLVTVVAFIQICWGQINYTSQCENYIFRE